MNLDLRYLGHSEARAAAWGTSLRLAPNLARPRVSYDAELAHPIRFREAMSALHDVVVGDLRFRKKDKTAYRAFRAEQAKDLEKLRAVFNDKAKKAELAQIHRAVVPPELPKRYHLMGTLYFAAYRAWSQEVWVTELFRHILMCDPVVTVAPDCVFFEGFAKDESAYGCLFVDRDAFKGESGSGLGTTNVDYSMALYDHFQGLRTYRPTRLQIDPLGFEVRTEGNPDLREEKIDLPASWLRGFGQLQAAMGLPSRKVSLPVEAVYSVLAFLKRHREKTGPRSLRFQLVPGRPPTLVLDPWGKSITCHGTVWDGEKPEEIKVWGRRRLFALARVLPMAEKIDVRLLGSGLPSVWTAHLGEMRLVLALSGWTANDWSGGAALDALSGQRRPKGDLAERAATYLAQSHQASLPQLAAALSAPESEILGAMYQLAQQGQSICDWARGVYRFRPVMPVALSEAMLGPEPPEILAGKALYLEGSLKIVKREALPNARRELWARHNNMECQAIVDSDGALTKARCGCSHFYRFKLKKGPCRHLLALKLMAQAEGERP